MTLEKRCASGHPRDLPESARNLIKKLEARPESEIMGSEALRVVRLVWPKAFMVSFPKPLKIGIHKDMKRSNCIPAHIIGVALRFFTRIERYLVAIKPGAARIDLNGKVAGKVRLSEAVDAEIKLFRGSSDSCEPVERTRIIISKIRLLAVKKAK
ncbi:MAG: ProQ/FINO family protein [Candidatus Endonucleobacter bathymodioli]|uniref:ProQ/FINO family protein n=1 Tax=Candidatus Endonucleibacter bathymodioli TaxID=539814 RepID=A0AA90STM2_9GAMM|nr:ProQ/FINO family protein [Candidatus Endonucleobacter bathymodioli]